MEQVLDVVITQTFDGRPLATVRNFPGGDADLTPAEMRRLAAALAAAAEECERQPMDRRNFRRLARSFPM